MVIGFDAKRAFCNATGLGNYSRMVISGLAETHPELTIRLYTPYRQEAYKNYFKGYGNITVVEPAFRIGSNSFWRSNGVSKVIRNDGLSLFHGLSHEIPQGLPENLPTVVTMHDMAAWRFPRFFPRWDRKVYQRKQRFACENADAIVAVSEQTKKDIVAFLGVPENKIHVVGQSCDPQFWIPVAAGEKERVRNKYRLPQRYVVCVGTVEERKNQLSAVKAMAKVDQGVGLVVVGRHQRYADKVKSEVSKLHMEDRVVFLDKADFSDFPALYTDAVCSLYLSVFEGFGIPVLESMCCGTPVVCSNESSLPEVGGDAAVLLSPMDVESVAEAVNRISKDDGFRSELVEKSRCQAERFRKEKVMAELYEVYMDLKTR